MLAIRQPSADSSPLSADAAGAVLGGPASSEHGGPVRRRAIVAVLSLLCVVWLWALVLSGGVARGPRAVTFGGDFALNMSSATLLKAGGNPYDGAQLLRTEQAYMTRQGIRVRLGAQQAPLTWGGYPPLFFWLLEPLSTLPFGPLALGWIALLLLSMLAGFLCLLRYLGWTSLLAPAAVFAVMPQTTLEAYYANPTGLVVAIIFIGLWLQRRHPTAAGVVLSLAFLKPQLAVPAVVIMSLFLVRERRRFLVGVAFGLTALAVATLVATGITPTLHWVGGLSAVSRMVPAQPNMAPLIGLYASWTDQTIRTGIQAGLVVLVLALTGRAWLQHRAAAAAPFLNIGWLWVAWFLVLPYAHFADEILLAPALLALTGRNGMRIGRPVVACMLFLMYCSAILFSARLAGAQLLALPLLVLTVVLYVDPARRMPAATEQPTRRMQHG